MKKIFLIISSSLLILSVAPRRFTISIAALSSFEWPGFLIILFPFATNAAAQALCIELLEAGACIDPDNWDGCIVAIIAETPNPPDGGDFKVH